MPVPQVKVGPNGQLIIDEQSLVIEQTNAKKGRKVLAKEAIIDDDNNGSGFYKKRQKSKEWSERETLKFYKALNTIGTDFLLMQSLFPHRTRQEMKLKFKKEEKVNRHLVEKALAYHQEFDTEMLEKSLGKFIYFLKIKYKFICHIFCKKYCIKWLNNKNIYNKAIYYFCIYKYNLALKLFETFKMYYIYFVFFHIRKILYFNLFNYIYYILLIIFI